MTGTAEQGGPGGPAPPPNNFPLIDLIAVNYCNYYDLFQLQYCNFELFCLVPICEKRFSATLNLIIPIAVVPASSPPPIGSSAFGPLNPKIAPRSLNDLISLF